MTHPKPNWHVGHNEVKNILHNEMGITKESIKDIIRDMAREELNAILGDNAEFIRETMKETWREVVKEELQKAMLDEVYPRQTKPWSFYQRDPEAFPIFISKVLKEEALEMMKEKFDISIQVKNHETKSSLQKEFNDFVIPKEIEVSINGEETSVSIEGMLNIEALSDEITRGHISGRTHRIRTNDGVLTLANHQIHDLATELRKLYNSRMQRKHHEFYKKKRGL